MSTCVVGLRVEKRVRKVAVFAVAVAEDKMPKSTKGGRWSDKGVVVPK